MDDKRHVWFQSGAVARASAQALGGEYLGEAASQGIWHVVKLNSEALVDQIHRLRLTFYPEVSKTVEVMLDALKRLVVPGVPSPSSAGGSSPQAPAGRVVPFVRPIGQG